MPRTTINIDAPILKDLKRLQRKEKKSLGRVVSDLLAWAIRAQDARKGAPPELAWHSRAMRARVNLEDKDAVWSLLDSGRRESKDG